MFKRTNLVPLLAALTLGALFLPFSRTTASAGQGNNFVLHPSGFGAHSYSAWKAGEGLPDSQGVKDQALYFQKMTATTTFAAGVAVFKGVEGLPASALDDLAFWYREDGHCGAGAPRFNVRIQPPAGPRQTLFFGCNSGMVPGGTATDDEGRNWFERRIVGPLPLGSTVVSLAIVFDEGEEFPPGYVHLDNIKAAGHVWTSASDNGNGAEITQSSVALEQLLPESISASLGLED